MIREIFYSTFFSFLDKTQLWLSLWKVKPSWLTNVLLNVLGFLWKVRFSLFLDSNPSAELFSTDFGFSSTTLKSLSTITDVGITDAALVLEGMS